MEEQPVGPGLAPDGGRPEPAGAPAVKDGRTWRVGTPAEVAWIQNRTGDGPAVTAGVPPMFDAYATVIVGADEVTRVASDSALLRLLAERTGDQPWWIGYLDTGAHDVVFPDAPRVPLYWSWNYVLVEAGPEQAGSWRVDDPWRGRLPELMFPADRTWPVSMLWDDDWRCVGGPAELIDDVLADAYLDAHRIDTEQDATPPSCWPE